MNDHFLKWIEIEKFKCFSNFKAEGFKRVNLIGGKNNVGKTAFMEACFIHTRAEIINGMIAALIAIKLDRESINILYDDYDEKNLQKVLDSTKYFSTSSNIRICSYFLTEVDATKNYEIIIDDKKSLIPARDLFFSPNRPPNIKIIDNFGWSDGGLNWAYEAIQKHDEEKELNQIVQAFDNSIESFKVIGNKPQCKVNGEYRDITEFGDGLKHYISIICALYACENGYLFIDEIGNGIHYTQHDRLWELILTLSKKTNCQVFAITHSKEMLESFARVAKNLDEQDISYTVLVKNKQQEIKSIVLDYDSTLESILEQGHEVR